MVPTYGVRSSGLSVVAGQLATRHAQAGHHVDVWCAAHMGNTEPEPPVGPTIRTFGRLGPGTLQLCPALLSYSRSEAGVAADVLHQHGIWTALSLATRGWHSRSRKPYVVAPHGALEPWALSRSRWKKRSAWVGWEGANLREAACLHATSRAEAQSIRRLGLANPIAVVQNGVDDAWLATSGNAEAFRRSQDISHGQRVALFVSRIHPKKGLPLLFRAICSLRPCLADWLFLIAGPDQCGHLSELRILVEQLGISSLVRFVGPLFGQEKRDALAAAELFVLPTYSENFAMVVAEALGVGVPVLTTTGTPWEELVTEGCGWWVAPDVDHVAQALAVAAGLCTRELCAMGARGRELVRSRYRASLAAGQLLDVYSWLIGLCSRPDFVLMD